MKMSSQTEVAVDLNVAVEGLSPVPKHFPKSNRDGMSTRSRPLCTAHFRLQTADESQMSVAVLHLHRCFRKGLHTYHRQVFLLLLLPLLASTTLNNAIDLCYMKLLNYCISLNSKGTT